MYTSYFSKMKKITGDYKFYCISRVCPKGVMAKMYGKLAPSADLLAKWKSGQITWEEYEVIYKKETLSKLNPHVVVKELGENAVLLCYEKSGDNCHRNVVAAWLRDAGYDIKEWK